MPWAALVPLQMGLPEFVPDLIAAASVVVFLLILTAIVGAAYKHVTGGIEWPTDEPEDEEDLHRGGQDDEWDYY